MKRITLHVFILLVIVAFALVTTPVSVFAAHARVDLLTADDFAVLAGSAVSDTGTTAIIGDVGLSPTGGTAITGLTCAEVTGTIYDTNGGYAGGGGGSTACLVTDASLLTAAKTSLATAYDDAAARTAAPDIATNLGGTTLTDGTYHAASGTFSITAGQTLTLDGEGNADAVFIFKMDSTLVTGSSSQVVLINDAQACNVYWQVGSSATLGTSTTLIGNILALTSITDNGGSTVEGRLLARDAAVTLNNTSVTKQTCVAAPTPTPSPSPSASPTPTPVSDSTSSDEGDDDEGDDDTSSSSEDSPTPTPIPSATLSSAAPGFPDTGNPRLPNTGSPQDQKSIPWGIVAGVFLNFIIFFLDRLPSTFLSRP